MTPLTLEQFKNLREKNGDLTVINVLDEDQFHLAHIPGTRNVPRDDKRFVQQVEKLAGGKSKPVVVYCASDDCEASPKAAKELEQAGFDNVYDFEGGTKAWKEAGEKLVAGGAARN
jgi:rhodanese-related sulfurtransferase